MSEGWIALHRKVLQSDVWENPDLFRFWTWCLLKASHSAVTKLVGYKAVALQRGQFVFGRRMAHLETGLSERTIRTCVTALKDGPDPRISVKTTNAYSIITILKWGDYQFFDRENDPQPTNERPTPDQRPTNDPVDFDTQSSLLPPRARAPARIVVEQLEQLKQDPPPPARASLFSQGEGGESEEPPPTYDPPDIPAPLLTLAREVIGLTPENVLIGWMTVEKWPVDWITKALMITAERGKRGMKATSYARGVLRDYQLNGGPEKDDLPSKNDGRGNANRSKTRQRLDQHDVGDVLEARRRGRAEAAGVGRQDDGFDWGA